MLTNNLNLEIKTNEKGFNVIDAKELYFFLEVKTRFNDWIVSRIKEYGFIENDDFVSFTEKSVKPESKYFEFDFPDIRNPKGGRPAKEYAISLDMAKELAMVERSDKGRQARRYFIEAEKKLKQKIVKPTKRTKKALLEYVDQRILTATCFSVWVEYYQSGKREYWIGSGNYPVQFTPDFHDLIVAKELLENEICKI